MRERQWTQGITEEVLTGCLPGQGFKEPHLIGPALNHTASQPTAE